VGINHWVGEKASQVIDVPVMKIEKAEEKEERDGYPDPKRERTVQEVTQPLCGAAGRRQGEPDHHCECEQRIRLLGNDRQPDNRAANDQQPILVDG
jgi:hypothetical protein